MSGTLGRVRQSEAPHLHRTRASLARLARVIENDLRLPAVVSDLARHADALCPERRFRHAELRSIVPEDHRRENRIGIRLPEGRPSPRRTTCHAHPASRSGPAALGVDLDRGSVGASFAIKLRISRRPSLSLAQAFDDEDASVTQGSTRAQLLEGYPDVRPRCAG
jgi:hypothetical protein